MWETTADVIREWDPYRLLTNESPRDEFDSEISSVVAQTSRIHSASDAAHAVSRVFSSSFEPELFTPNACSDIGAQLFRRLQERGLLSDHLARPTSRSKPNRGQNARRLSGSVTQPATFIEAERSLVIRPESMMSS